VNNLGKSYEKLMEVRIFKKKILRKVVRETYEKFTKNLGPPKGCLAKTFVGL